jgi:hypothetical protein
MKRLIRPVLLLLLFAVPSRCPAQTRPAPFYSLPRDGTWVEYEWTCTPRDGEVTRGTLRLAAVGRTTVDGESCRCVEIRLVTGEGDASHIRLRKLLIAEQALKDGASLTQAVRRCFEKTGDRVKSLTGKARLDFLGLALREGAVLREQGRATEIETKLGKFSTRHVATHGGGATGRDYEGWLSDEVPFGWARFEVHDRAPEGKKLTVFRASAVRRGDGASSQVDESKAR